MSSAPPPWMSSRKDRTGIQFDQEVHPLPVKDVMSCQRYPVSLPLHLFDAHKNAFGIFFCRCELNSSFVSVRRKNERVEWFVR